jgi:hypothetical protein
MSRTLDQIFAAQNKGPPTLADLVNDMRDSNGKLPFVGYTRPYVPPSIDGWFPTMPPASVTQAKQKPAAMKRKKRIPATLKRLVWNANVGEAVGKTTCICCRVTEITQMSFHCGHVIPETHGGETVLSNLKPICQNCNSSMGTTNMNVFMSQLC